MLISLQEQCKSQCVKTAEPTLNETCLRFCQTSRQHSAHVSVLCMPPRTSRTSDTVCDQLPQVKEQYAHKSHFSMLRSLDVLCVFDCHNHKAWPCFTYAGLRCADNTSKMPHDCKTVKMPRSFMGCARNNLYVQNVRCLLCCAYSVYMYYALRWVAPATFATRHAYLGLCPQQHLRANAMTLGLHPQ